MTAKKTIDKTIIGIVEHVTIDTCAVDVPAKVDTGADSSSVWATDIRVDEDGILHFRLFGEGSEFYDRDKIFSRKDYSVVSVKNSTGHSEVRYRTHFIVTVGGRKIRALFNLSDRSRNTYKILIGRRTISRKFLVDVSIGALNLPRRGRAQQLKSELLKNPIAFHKKYNSK